MHGSLYVHWQLHTRCWDGRLNFPCFLTYYCWGLYSCGCCSRITKILQTKEAVCLNSRSCEGISCDVGADCSCVVCSVWCTVQCLSKSWGVVLYFSSINSAPCVRPGRGKGQGVTPHHWIAPDSLYCNWLKEFSVNTNLYKHSPPNTVSLHCLLRLLNSAGNCTYCCTLCRLQ